MGFFTASRLNKMKTNFRSGDIEKAIVYADKINPAEIRTTYDLSMMADVYMSVERYGAARRVYVELYKKNRSIRVCKQLVDLNLKMKNVKQAIYYVKELCSLDPEDYERFIFKYRIGKMLNQSDGYLIDCLKKVREADYIDKWALELAKLFFKTGKIEKCIKECQNIKLWFPDTEYAEKADKLLAACNSGITYEETMSAVKSDEAAYTAEPDTYYDNEDEIADIKETEAVEEDNEAVAFENESSDEIEDEAEGEAEEDEDFESEAESNSDDWDSGWDSAWSLNNNSHDDWDDDDDDDWDENSGDWEEVSGSFENFSNEPMVKDVTIRVNTEDIPTMTEISVDEDQIFFDLSESVKDVMKEENEAYESQSHDQRPDIATTLVNDSLTSEVLDALREQERNGISEDNDAVDESILKMINED